MKIPLDTELKNYKILPCNKIHALNLPTGVKAYITLQIEYDLEDSFPLKNNSILRFKKNDRFIKAEQYYLHTVGTSNTPLELMLNTINYDENTYVEIEQQDNQTMNLNEEVETAIKELSSLGKVVNPYDMANSTIISDSLASTTITTMINVTLDCDKIIYSLIGGTALTNESAVLSGQIAIFLDDVLIDVAGGRNLSGVSVINPQNLTEIENVRGKNLKITFRGDTISYVGKYHIQKINLKA